MALVGLLGASAVPSNPAINTGLSPNRSVARPHGNSDRAMPRPVALNATPSCALSKW
jgi:hypothetical protein